MIENIFLQILGLKKINAQAGMMREKRQRPGRQPTPVGALVRSNGPAEGGLHFPQVAAPCLLFLWVGGFFLPIKQPIPKNPNDSRREMIVNPKKNVIP